MAKKTEQPIFRKAEIKKGKTFKFGQKLKKGEQVFITEKFMGHSRYTYTAVRNIGDTLEFGVTRSEFEYTENEKFIVLVNRISYASRNIEVEAKDRKMAERLAFEEAGSLEFREHDADYQIDSVISKTEHKDMFPNSEIHN